MLISGVSLGLRQGDERRNCSFSIFGHVGRTKYHDSAHDYERMRLIADKPSGKILLNGFRSRLPLLENDRSSICPVQAW